MAPNTPTGSASEVKKRPASSSTPKAQRSAKKRREAHAVSSANNLSASETPKKARLDSFADNLPLGLRALAGLLAFGPSAFGPFQASSVEVNGAKRSKEAHVNVSKTLALSVPGIQSMRGERGMKSVTQMISDCERQGLFMLGPPQSPVNNQVIPAIRFIFAEMTKLPANAQKRVNCLTALAQAFQDCQQVQAREILRLYGDLTAQTLTFEKQLRYSLLRCKEAALDSFISQRHGRCDEDHTRVKPWQQRAHLTSGYTVIVGDEFGLDGITAAKHDRFLSQVMAEIGRVDKAELVQLLKSSLSIEDWLRTLLADINNQTPGADRLINQDCIFKWAQEHMSVEAAHAVFFDDARAREFDEQDPNRPSTENAYQPFLSCKVLVCILLAMGMLKIC
mmetsp:Transcript_58419/g.136539  ORF Transcript_58419/g.136539 Transcript_58419/m.136539 type:complete len:393 (+) Transcript_58419:79-1257(+)